MNLEDFPAQISKQNLVVLNAIRKFALNELDLEDARKDRQSSAEDIAEAAQHYRRSEAQMNEAVRRLVDLIKEQDVARP